MGIPHPAHLGLRPPDLVLKARMLGPKGLMLFNGLGDLVAVAHEVRKNVFRFTAETAMEIVSWGRKPEEGVNPSNYLYSSTKALHAKKHDEMQIEIQYDDLEVDITHMSDSLFRRMLGGR